MEKNENGYPQARVTPENNRNGINGATGGQSEVPMDHINNDGMSSRGGRMNGTGGSTNGTHHMNDANHHMNGTNNRMNGTGNMGSRSMGNGCGSMTDSCLDSRPLAYVYAPNQSFCMLHSASDALDRGTLFEALYKPMEVYGRE